MKHETPLGNFSVGRKLAGNGRRGVFEFWGVFAGKFYSAGRHPDSLRGIGFDAALTRCERNA
jgi:hypothetical protein